MKKYRVTFIYTSPGKSFEVEVEDHESAEDAVVTRTEAIAKEVK